MPTKKRAGAPIEVSRLKVLAAGDEVPYRDAVSEMLRNGDRLAREAVLETLVERPLPELRGLLRSIYFEIDADGPKHDPAAHVRGSIVRVLLAIADTRDVDIGLRASETCEKVNGTDGTSPLRSLGLRLVAIADPDLMPYIAVEHVSDRSEFSPEPASTALQLLAGSGHELAVYQWLFSRESHEPELVAAAFELLADAPKTVMSRVIAKILSGAIEREDEWLLTTLSETIVKREMEDVYPALASMLRSRISDELFSYVALLLAATNRRPLLAILDEHMADPRRRAPIVAALRVRTTPEQAAILKRWEEDGG
jgi:hypothetical protein